MLSVTGLAVALTHAEAKRRGQALKAVVVSDEHYQVLAHDMDVWKFENNQPAFESTLRKLFVRGVEVFKNSDVLDLRDDS